MVLLALMCCELHLALFVQTFSGESGKVFSEHSALHTAALGALAEQGLGALG